MTEKEAIEQLRRVATEARNRYYGDTCKTCRGSYNLETSVFCSNGFHLCRDCYYREGKIIFPCDLHKDDYQRTDRYPKNTIADAARLALWRYLVHVKVAEIKNGILVFPGTNTPVIDFMKKKSIMDEIRNLLDIERLHEDDCLEVYKGELTIFKKSNDSEQN